MSQRFLVLWFLGLSLAAGFSRTQLGPERGQNCSFDGLELEGAGRIDFVEAGEPGRRIASFCSVECALAWPARAHAAAGSRFVVYEERHGSALDPAAAFFVCSPGRKTGARGGLRAFADPLSAAEYARAFDAVIVPNPFAKDR